MIAPGIGTAIGAAIDLGVQVANLLTNFFGGRRREKTLNAIEENTRFHMLYGLSQLALAIQWWPFIFEINKTLHDRLGEEGIFGGIHDRLLEVSHNTSGAGIAGTMNDRLWEISRNTNYLRTGVVLAEPADGAVMDLTPLLDALATLRPVAPTPEDLVVAKPYLVGVSSVAPVAPAPAPEMAPASEGVLRTMLYNVETIGRDLKTGLSLMLASNQDLGEIRDHLTGSTGVLEGVQGKVIEAINSGPAPDATAMVGLLEGMEGKLTEMADDVRVIPVDILPMLGEIRDLMEARVMPPTRPRQTTHVQVVMRDGRELGDALITEGLNDVGVVP
jgi:hypothetical protein